MHEKRHKRKRQASNEGGGFALPGTLTQAAKNIKRPSFRDVTKLIAKAPKSPVGIAQMVYKTAKSVSRPGSPANLTQLASKLPLTSRPGSPMNLTQLASKLPLTSRPESVNISQLKVQGQQIVPSIRAAVANKIGMPTKQATQEKENDVSVSPKQPTTEEHPQETDKVSDELPKDEHTKLEAKNDEQQKDKVDEKVNDNDEISNNPVQQLDNEADDITKELRETLSNPKIDPQEKRAKVKALQEKLENISTEAEDMKNGLEEEQKDETSSNTKPASNVATLMPQKGGEGEPVSTDQIKVDIADTPGEKKGIFSKLKFTPRISFLRKNKADTTDADAKAADTKDADAKAAEAKATDAEATDAEAAAAKAADKEKNEQTELANIKNEAIIEVARADVQLIYDYVQKTSDPRALKAIFEYQEGKDEKQDILSKHLEKVKAIIADNPSKAIKKKAEALVKELQLARVKLYSINVETALRRIEDAEAEVSFFPDELKTELSEKQKRITTAILVVFSIIKYVFKQFGKAPGIVRIYIILLLFIIILSAYLAFKYCILIVNDYVNNKLINNPTNAESLDFLIANFGNSPPREVNEANTRTDARSKKEISVASNPVAKYFIDTFKQGISPIFGNMLSAKYKYGWFVVLPWIALIAGLLGALYVCKKRKNELHMTPGLVQVILYAGIVQAFIALIANHAIYFYAYYALKGTSFRIDNYNKHVLANMIQKADFLAYLQKLPTSTIGIANVTGDALRTLFRNGQTPTVSDLSKAMFTLNLYEHYQQLGYRNPLLYEALDSFRIYTFIFSKQGFSPALYLRRRATLIRDNGEKYRNRIEMIYRNENRPINNTLIDNAIIQSSRITAEANNMANSFFPEDAMSRFLRMAIMIAIVQFLPFTIFVYLFRNKDLRNGFINAIRVIIGQKKNASDADIRDQEEEVVNLREMMKNRKEAPPPPPVQPPAPPVATI